MNCVIEMRSSTYYDFAEIDKNLSFGTENPKLSHFTIKKGKSKPDFLYNIAFKR